VPGNPEQEGPNASERRRLINWRHTGAFQHIGYPSVAQMPDGTVVASYHEWDTGDRPLQFVLCTRFRVD